MTTTLAWRDLAQHKSNQAHGSQLTRVVRLQKYEKDADGNITAHPVPNAEFYLFDGDGNQIGGRCLTDETGRIEVGHLPVGDYYFVETSPGYGYGYDTDENGAVVKYEFTVRDGEHDVVVHAFNRRLTGGLFLSKTVRNADGSDLSADQLNAEFTFTVVFSDAGTYEYSIDGAPAQEIASSGALTLKHGQTAEFIGLPAGLHYEITETPVAGYLTQSNEHAGNILVDDTRIAAFTNTWFGDGTLTITKQVSGETADESKDFEFTIVFSDGETYDYTIDGGPAQSLTGTGVLVLKHGQTAVFENLPAGVAYTVTESDYTADGYTTLVGSYAGVTTNAAIRLPFVNHKASGNDPGSLALSKTVTGADIDPEKPFRFIIAFSNGVSYPYSIDGGQAQSLDGDNSLTLTQGQTAIFENRPAGITYTVTEDDYTADGYVAAVGTAQGTIAAGTRSAAALHNHRGQTGGDTQITVTKILDGEYPEVDREKEFAFTLHIALPDGTTDRQDFTLVADETKTFPLPSGAAYTVSEADVSAYDYMQTGIVNGSGIADGQTVEVLQTNLFVGRVMIKIEGEKTWNMAADPAAVLPESITVQLKNGGLTVQERTVTPENGEWKYVFEAPKYEADGVTVVDYTVDETPIISFEKKVTGYNIENTYIKPVLSDPPVAQKVITGDAPEKVAAFRFIMTAVDGAPMPEGSTDGQKIIEITGEGQQEFGDLLYTEPGVYAYIITEQLGTEDGYTYDTGFYTLTVEVGREGDTLTIVSREYLHSGGETETHAIFTNIYKTDTPPPELITVSGRKTWNHGTNPAANQPESITVQVLKDGRVVYSRQVSVDTHWSWAVALPRYDGKGNENIYTFD